MLAAAGGSVAAPVRPSPPGSRPCRMSYSHGRLFSERAPATKPPSAPAAPPRCDRNARLPSFNDEMPNQPHAFLVPIRYSAEQE